MRIEELLIRVKDDSRDTIYCDGEVNETATKLT